MLPNNYEEVFKYKNREFLFKVEALENKFKVVCIDKKDNSALNLTGTCSYKNYLEALGKGLGEDPIKYLVGVLKDTVKMWIDKSII